MLVTGGVLLGALSLGMFNLPGDLEQGDFLTSRPDSVAAMETLSAAYPERSTQPVTVITPTDRADDAPAKARATEGVASVERGRSGGGWTELSVITRNAPESPGEPATIEAPRSGLDGSYVGGFSAQQMDLEKTDARDREPAAECAREPELVKSRS